MDLRTTAVQLPFTFDTTISQENHGAVYTRPWVVDLILDAAGYRSERDLASTVAVEPAVGDGAFVIAIVRRLIMSARSHGHSPIDCRGAIRGFDLDSASVEAAREAVISTLIDLDVSAADAKELASAWIQQGNYLFEVFGLPSADFVIGNPPYIRLEDIGNEILASYRAMYQTMKGRADIYVAFFEAALHQLKPDGVCALICADRWMLNQYGASLRSLITGSFSVETVIEMHAADAFEIDVSAYPAITIIRRAAQGAVVVARADAAAKDVDTNVLTSTLEETRTRHVNVHSCKGLRAARVEAWFKGSAPWPCTSPERLQVLRYLEENFHPLESGDTGTRVGIGVATGCDEVFITSDPELVEPDRLLPLAMAADTLDGTLNWSGHFLVDPWNEHGVVNLREYPRLLRYFEQNREKLGRRHVAKRQPENWYRTIDRVTHSLTGKPKLYFPDIKNRIHPVLDSGQTYPHHNLYFIQSEDWNLPVLGGLLLSDIGQFFVECYGVRMRGGWLRFQAQYLRRIRVPRPESITPEQAEALTDAFRRRCAESATKVALDIYQLDGLPTGDD